MFNLRHLFFRRPFTTSTAHSNFHENFYSLLTKGHLDEALTLFYTSDISHTHQTYADFFHACARHNCISQGQTLHHHMIKTQKERKLITNVYVYNHLINMYAKCGCLDHARKVFDEMPERNVVSWTALISGYAQHERCEDGFGVFSVMLGVCRPNEFAYASVLSSCDRKFGRQVHSHALKTCFGFQTRGKWQEAIDLFSVMRRDSNISFDHATLLSIVSSLSTIKDHDNETAGRRDIVSWTAFITIFAERDPVKSLLMFSNLCQEGSIPDRHTYSIVLKACSNLVTDKHTMAVHSHILKYGFEHDTVLANALIHAYGRSGSVLESRKVFDFTLVKDIVSWNSMIKIYGLHGQPKNALKCFDQMDVPPDSTTFVALLSACSHAGMVEKGTELFELMSKTYGIAPQLDHYACMVDILGRSGGILQAQKLINEMPMEPDSVIWSAMLGACRKHGETTLAELASKKLQELDPNSSLAYVQMSNIMCSNGTFNEAVDLRTQMNWLGVKKDPGLSWTEIGNVVHEFAAGGLHHPERMTVRHDLEELVKELRGLGYVPEINLVMRDLEEEDKNRELSYHSEKLAFVFALKRDEFKCFGRAIRIVKNIRICVDCHNFMKFASELTGREIIVRDLNRFHHFKQKVCSCNDYW
ncbi:putative tetratricopeptide-like helical domain superfamily, DYW domain-containing protein [Helianthus annuus]|nr:putative tetratricopeptide-like helical domain superfamily, DYW domain-containing protein [Helianthus annuus]